MAGRKPLPTNLKILRGNPGKRPLPKNEPRPPKDKPSCPAFVTGDARKEWKRIAPLLAAMGLLSKIDRTALAAYCTAYARWLKAEKIVKEKGELYKTASGNVMTSPMLWVANKAMDQMHKFMAEFGMTPSSRTRITTSEDGPESAFKRFLGGKTD